MLFNARLLVQLVYYVAILSCVSLASSKSYSFSVILTCTKIKFYGNNIEIVDVPGHMRKSKKDHEKEKKRLQNLLNKIRIRRQLHIEQ